MRSIRSPQFKRLYEQLPITIQKEADKAYELWAKNSHHPSLQFKPVTTKPGLWSVRVSHRYRALGVRKEDLIVWVWIGPHTEYDKYLR